MPLYDMSRNFFTTEVDEGTPFAPIAAWSSSGLDYTPNFDISLPTGMNDPTDAAVGDIVFGEYQTAGGDWSASHSYLSYVLTAPDLSGGTVTVSGVSNLTPGNYDFRWRLERTIHASDWSNTVTIVLIPPTLAVKTFLGGKHTIAPGIHSLTQAFTIPNNCVVVVGGYWRIGDDTDAPMTASVGSTSLSLYVPSVIDQPFAFACGFCSGVVTTGGSLNVTVDFGSSTAGQVIGFFVWTITGLTYTSPKAGASQLNTNLSFGNPPSQITVAATDFAFAVAQHNNAVNQTFQASTPPADHDPSTDSNMVDNVYHIGIAGDWEIGANGTLTVATTSNGNNTTRSVISFDTTS